MTTKDKALTIIDPSTYAIATPDALEFMADIDAPSFDELPLIKVPAGGGTSWELPNGEPAKEFQGIILDRQETRGYWISSFEETGGGSPPDCSSLDNRHGNGMYDGTHFNAEGDLLNPGGLCQVNGVARCPMAQWGSGKGNAQACRLITRVPILLPDALLPAILRLPPSSYGKNDQDGIAAGVRKYEVNQVSLGRRLWQVITAVSLVKDTSAGNHEYSAARFRSLGNVPPALAAVVKRYREAFLPTITAAAVEAE